MTPRRSKKMARNAPGPGLSAEERTPKRLKSVEPDLTVVVGGEEFYHYKVILCSGCDFFDTMLATKMKENEESRIEFPDKDPEEWVQVYPFLDTGEKRPKITKENALMLIAWFDYLGMDDLARQCDSVYAKSFVISDDLKSFIKAWNDCKNYPCPESHVKVLSSLEDIIGIDGITASKAAKLKELIRDEVGGESVWQIVKSCSYINLPSEVEGLGRVELAENPLFECVLRMSHINNY